MYGFEAEGAAAIVNDEIIAQPETVDLAVKARDASNRLHRSRRCCRMMRIRSSNISKA